MMRLYQAFPQYESSAGGFLGELKERLDDLYRGTNFQ